MNATVEEKIKNIRELKNLTQEFVASQLGMSQASYSKIESGTTSLTFTKLVEISQILGVEVQDILNFDSQKYFNSFNNVRGNNNGSITIQTENLKSIDEFKKLYEDKISLLERLLEKIEDELSAYKKKFGPLQ